MLMYELTIPGAWDQRGRNYERLFIAFKYKLKNRVTARGKGRMLPELRADP